MKHPLINRTSPTGKGQPFVGTCAACGKRGLTPKMIEEDDCPNPQGMTREQALLEAIEGGAKR